MGFVPLADVTMGARPDNIDPALTPFIMEETDRVAEQVLEILNKELGLLGLSGTSSNLRDLSKETELDKAYSQMALDIFASKTHRYIGSYTVRMHGTDAIVFIAGIGENSIETHAKVLEGLKFMGIYWDLKKNENLLRGREGSTNYPHSPVKVVVTPVDEESMIARNAMTLDGLK